MSDPVPTPIEELVQRPAGTMSFTVACADRPGFIEVGIENGTNQADLVEAAQRLGAILLQMTLGEISAYNWSYGAVDPVPEGIDPAALANRKANLNLVSAVGTPVRISIPAADPSLFRPDGSLDEDDPRVVDLMEELTADGSVWCDSRGTLLRGLRGGRRYDTRSAGRSLAPQRTDDDTTANN